MGRYLSPRKTEIPSDSFNMVYIICLVLGCGTLLSYNSLVSCATYFNYQFRDYPNIMFIIVPTYSVPNLFFTILMIPFGDRLSWTFKITFFFIIIGFLISVIPFLVSSDHNLFHLTQTQSYHIFIVIIAVIGALNAIIQCSVIGFTGLLPTKYLQTVLGGQALSGISVCIIRIFSKLAIPLTPIGIARSGMIYFIVSACISFICAISFNWCKESAFVQHHVQERIDLKFSPKMKRVTMKPNEARTKTNEIKIAVLVRQDTPHTLAAFVDDCAAAAGAVSFVDDDDVLKPLRNNNKNTIKSYGAAANTPKYYVQHHKFNRSKYISVLHNIRYLVISIYLAMFGTFLWFPGILTKIDSSFEILNKNGEWMPIILILEFNIFDYFGRQFLSSYNPLWLKENNLWIASAIKMLSYPVLIAFQKKYIVNDYLLHIVIIISALTNGWLSSLAFMWFPRNVTKKNQQIAASIMTLGCITGILCGSCCALLIQRYL